MNLKDLKTELQEDIEPCPAERMYTGLRKGFIDLCEFTHAFRETAVDLTVIGRTDYVITPLTADTSAVGLYSAAVATLASPTLSIAAAVTGGNLTASTYYYKVTAYDDSGETIASQEISQITSGATSAVTISWTAIPGATGYRVYGRSSGAELLLAVYTKSTDSWNAGTGTETSWIDADLSITPAGALPTETRNARDVDITNVGELRNSDRRWTSDTAQSSLLGFISSVSFDGVGTVRLSRIPGVADVGLQFEAALLPSNSWAIDAAIPSIFEQYSETLKNFAKFYLHGLSANIVPWADLAMAGYFRTLYEKDKRKLRLRVFSGFGGGMRVRPGPYR